MTKAEAEAVRRFKHTYPELCRGENDDMILLRAKFVEAVRREIRKERDRVSAVNGPGPACCHEAGALGRYI